MSDKKISDRHKPSFDARFRPIADISFGLEVLRRGWVLEAALKLGDAIGLAFAKPISLSATMFMGTIQSTGGENGRRVLEL